MICWFEDRANGTRLQMEGFVERIAVRHASKLNEGLTRIEAAQARGHWIALVLEYELGAWLEPSLSRTDDEPGEHLVALVYERAREVRIDDPPTQPHAARILSAAARVGRESHLKTIEEIRTLIAAGEVYQINATLPLEVHTQGAAISLYRQLASGNSAKHCAYIEDLERRRFILSFSPELFVSRQNTTLVTRPMKGTAPRIPTDPLADQAKGEALLNSVKDRAENVMIVDLLRNDLGRIAVPGSVKVDPLFSLEAYPTVWSMTSTITAQIKPNCRLIDILQALFPCGSVTGAPKIAAMRHIRQLELSPRGVYCGSVGWLAPHGDMSLNVAIRTLVLDENGVGVYGVGGGIVHDSIAEHEWQECFWKARILGVKCETETD